MLANILHQAVPALFTLAIVGLGAVGLYLLPWSDEELALAESAVQKTREAVRRLATAPSASGPLPRPAQASAARFGAGQPQIG
jgi:hypothetical protein